MDQSAVRKLNPQISVQNQRNEYKKVENEVTTMKNRVQLLRLQLEKQKQTIKKNKQLTKQTIQKKIEFNKINQYKNKDDTSQMEKIEELRKRNRSLRQSHNKQLEDIQKAIYLVKLDDARELKNVSQQHKKKLEEMDREFLSQQKQKKKKVAQESSKAKEKYMKYWKQKIGSLYLEQAQNVMEISKKKQSKKKEFQSLQQEQMRLLEQINKYHTQEVETKKQYLAAMSLPVKDVAEAMGQSMVKKKKGNISGLGNRSSLDMTQSRALNNSMLGGSNRSLGKGIRIPNSHVNEDKLKVILKQLKKMDRNSTHSAR